MKYVIDASVVLKWVLAEPDFDKALALRESYRQHTDALIAPSLLLVECGHGLFRARNKNVIAAGQPRRLLAKIMADGPVLMETTNLVSRAGEIAEQYRVGFYDACYLALADTESCGFVTADRKLLNIASKNLTYIIDLANMP